MRPQLTVGYAANKHPADVTKIVEKTARFSDAKVTDLHFTMWQADSLTAIRTAGRGDYVAVTSYLMAWVLNRHGFW